MTALQLLSVTDRPLSNGKIRSAWPDVPYHYYVATDGSVGEGRDWRYVGDTNTNYDTAGHLLVVVEGNFTLEDVSVEQRRTLEVIIPVLAHHFHIPPDKIGAHKDFAATQCPGKKLLFEIPRLQKIVGHAK